MKTFILAQSLATARALGAWLELIGDPPLQSDGATGQITDPRCLLQDNYGVNNPSTLFDKVAVRLWEEVTAFDKRVTVLVDTIDFDKLNPLNNGWDATVAMWILAFPEIHWRFGVISCNTTTDNSAGCPENPSLEALKSTHCLASLFRPKQEPLFDGSGLREHIRQTIRMHYDKPAPYLPRRADLAVAMDDEVSYVYFNAYTAYRFGFRAHAVRRFKQAQDLLGDSNKNLKIRISFEDVYLNFPDKEASVHLSDLSSPNAGRQKFLPKLSFADYRNFVTSSQTATAGDGQRERNRQFIRTQKGADGKRNAMEVQKPLSGMFDLWSKTGLDKKLNGGVGKDFQWPPPKELMQGESVKGHGSPGRLLQIGELLIRRSEKMVHEGISSVREAVTAAVLATDALELLGDRTPTTAIDALGLKHKCEVLAECQFSGTEYHIEIKKRLKEIRKECETLSSWFHPTHKNMAAWNAEMHIVNHLVRILREHNQFDEEAICMNRVRRLHNRLWVRQKPLIFRPFLLAFAGYATWLMSSFLNFAISFFGCVILLAGFRWWVELPENTWDDMPKSPILQSLVIGTQEVFSFFVGANGFNNESWGMSLVLALAAILGLIHLGIFLSFLYSIISRKS